MSFVVSVFPTLMSCSGHFAQREPCLDDVNFRLWGQSDHHDNAD